MKAFMLRAALLLLLIFPTAQAEEAPEQAYARARATAEAWTEAAKKVIVERCGAEPAPQVGKGLSYFSEQVVYVDCGVETRVVGGDAARRGIPRKFAVPGEKGFAVELRISRLEQGGERKDAGLVTRWEGKHPLLGGVLRASSADQCGVRIQVVFHPELEASRRAALVEILEKLQADFGVKDRFAPGLLEEVRTGVVKKEEAK